MRPPKLVYCAGWLRGRVPGGEFDMGCWAYRPSRAPGELCRVSGETAMPLFGDAWFVKYGTDLVHSLVRVAPRADSSGDVVAL
jgi:hypothetical protein